MTDREKAGYCKLRSCLVSIAKMQSDCENCGVFKDFGFATVVVFAYHLSSRRLKKAFQNWYPRPSKTIPKRSSISGACRKRFRNGFGRILDSQMASQKRSLRPPRGHQKRILSNLASREASRTGLEGFWTPKWPPKRGPRGELEAFKHVFFSAWPLRRPPERILEAIWISWGRVLNHFSK